MKRSSHIFQDSGEYKELGLVDSLAAQMSSRVPNQTGLDARSEVLVVDDENPVPRKYRKSSGSDGFKTMKSENDPSFELAEIERSRNHLLARLRAGGDYLNNKKKFCIKTQKDFDEDTKNAAVSLVERMHSACIQDYEAIKKGKPAMHRFQMIEEVTELLKKKHIQEIFLEMQGCRFLEMWISQNPDNSYPPIQIVECVLNVLNVLPISQEHLESCQVARAVTQFAASNGGVNGEQKLPASLISTATKLLQKWQTVVYQLSYEYDQDGQHEIKQRDLRRRLEVLRELDKTQGSKAGAEDDLIKKTPNGFIFLKQNFDWMDKPQSSTDAELSRGNPVKSALNTVFKSHKASSMRNSRK